MSMRTASHNFNNGSAASGSANSMAFDYGDDHEETSSSTSDSGATRLVGGAKHEHGSDDGQESTPILTTASSSNSSQHTQQNAIDGQHRVLLACTRCRKQKLKCDGTMPACARCQKRGAECVYSNEPTGRKNGSKKKTPRREKKRLEETATNLLAGGVAVVTNRPTHKSHAGSLASSSSSHMYNSSHDGESRTPRAMTEMVLPSQRPAPQLVALEQLSRKLKMELDSYSSMAKHWQTQLQLLNKGGPDAVTDEQAVRWLKRRRLQPRQPKLASARPRFLPENRNAGESWSSYTSEAHPSIHLAHAIVAFSDRALVANPLATAQDPAQLDLRCHRFRIMRFWDMSSPRELLTDTLSYDTLVAAWDVLLQPISTTIQGNAFVDEIGRPLEDDLDANRTIDSIAIFGHTAEIEEVLTVMEFGCLFFHATQLVGWDDQLHHLATNVDRLLQIVFFQRQISTIPELADRAINFIMWYVWRYKAFKMFTAYRSLLNVAYSVLIANLDHVSPSIAGPLNRLLISTSTSIQQMMTHVHLADRLSLTTHGKALLRLAIGIVTLSLPDTHQLHFEQLEAGYPELVSLIESVHNPFDPQNLALLSTALFVHAEVLIRLGRDIKIVEDLVDSAIATVVEHEACGAVHLLFSSMFMFQATVNTVVQFSNGTTCTISDYARIEVAKALGFPLSNCTTPHEDPKTEETCKLKFGEEFMSAINRLGQFQPCNGTCDPNNKDASATSVQREDDPATQAEYASPDATQPKAYLVHRCGCPAATKGNTSPSISAQKLDAVMQSPAPPFTPQSSVSTATTTSSTSSRGNLKSGFGLAAAAAASSSSGEGFYSASASTDSALHRCDDCTSPSEVITPDSEDHTHHHHPDSAESCCSSVPGAACSSSNPNCCRNDGNTNNAQYQQHLQYQDMRYAHMNASSSISSSATWSPSSTASPRSITSPHSTQAVPHPTEYSYSAHHTHVPGSLPMTSSESQPFHDESSSTSMQFEPQSLLQNSTELFFPSESGVVDEYAYKLTMSGEIPAWNQDEFV